MDKVTRGEFAKRLVNGLDCKVSQHRKFALVAWMSAENTPARFNPLATTWPMPHSSDFNTTHVKNYASLRDGVEATLLTLKKGDKQYGYGAIIKRIKANAPAREILEAVAHSAWGTGALALQILPYVKENPEAYAGKAIGQ